MRFLRTLQYLWVENFVVGTVNVPSVIHSTILANPLLAV